MNHQGEGPELTPQLFLVVKIDGEQEVAAVQNLEMIVLTVAQILEQVGC